MNIHKITAIWHTHTCRLYTHDKHSRPPSPAHSPLPPDTLSLQTHVRPSRRASLRKFPNNVTIGANGLKPPHKLRPESFIRWRFSAYQLSGRYNTSPHISSSPTYTYTYTLPLLLHMWSLKQETREKIQPRQQDVGRFRRRRLKEARVTLWHWNSCKTTNALAYVYISQVSMLPTIKRRRHWKLPLQ